MGELIAWIIGWDLILEYAGSNMSVSVGFAAHVVDLLELVWHSSERALDFARLPARRTAGPCRQGYLSGRLALRLQHPCVPDRAAAYRRAGCAAFANRPAPTTSWCSSSWRRSCCSSSLVRTSSSRPTGILTHPNGWSGILTGGSIIFFTYIGFDSVSTASEECRKPAA